MILNELSMQKSSFNQKNIKLEDINQTISQFLNVCNQIYKNTNDLDFYYVAEWMTKELVPGYTFYEWLKHPQVPQKEKAFFRTMINRRQCIKEKDFLDSEMMIKDERGKYVSAVGCLVAYELENYVVSMNTSNIWRTDEIERTYISLEADDKKVVIQNCCFENQIGILQKKIKSKLMISVSSGQELWEKREILYPHLLFCDCVQKQLKEARISLHIQMIMERIQILEDYFANFGGCFHKNDVGYGCRAESETVENNEKLRKMRIFRTPYGYEEFFTWHISFPGNFPGRIHFIPDTEHHLGIIGYIGKHLPTGKFSTI